MLLACKSLAVQAVKKVVRHSRSDFVIYAGAFAQAQLRAPLDLRKTAAAYDSLCKARRKCPQAIDDLVKEALVAMRDLIVRVTCCLVGFTSRCALENEWTTAFGRPSEEDLASQLSLSYATIVRKAGTPDAFKSKRKSRNRPAR